MILEIIEAVILILLGAVSIAFLTFIGCILILIFNSNKN